jgi:Cu/Ag efflux pump CusA
LASTPATPPERTWRRRAPVLLTAGVIAVLIDGGTMELGSLVGFLAIFGVAVRNGVVLLRRYQHLERHEGQPFGRDLVLHGARERMAPILLTTAATGMFFLPFVALGDLPGHEIVNPMGGVILGGLVTSTVLSLFLLPALYLRFGYGQGLITDLDLRELWEELQVQNGEPVTAATGNGEMVASEIGPAAPQERPQ